jgi:hypothetical protein
MGDSYYQVDPSWPGLSKNQDIDTKHTDIKAVVKALQKHVDAMSGPRGGDNKDYTGSFYDVHYNCYIRPQELGTWDAAKTFAKTVGFTDDNQPTGASLLKDHYKNFIEQLQGVIDGINSGRATIMKADDASTVNPGNTITSPDVPGAA